MILEKTPRDDIRKEVLPLLYTAFDFSDIEVQVSCNCGDFNNGWLLLKLRVLNIII